MPLLTIKQTAAQLSLCTRSIRRAINAGEITIVSLGKGAKGDRIDQSDIDRYIERRRINRGPIKQKSALAIRLGPTAAEIREARLAYKQTIAWKEEQKKALQRRKNEFPLRFKARSVLSAAIRVGAIIPAPCWVCGKSKVDGHHPDYSHPLDVIWLCRLHHREVHSSISV